MLKQSRQAAGLTQEALAARAGLSARAISDLERNVNHVPRPATVRLLVAALPLSAFERQLMEAAAGSAVADVEVMGARPAQGRASTSVLSDPRKRWRSPELVGREREQVLLKRHLGGDGPPLLVIGGEPGIGKTQLLQEATRLADVLGLHVLPGSSPPLRGHNASDPVVDALRHELRTREPVNLRRDLHGCAWLVHVLPELASGPIEPLPTGAMAAGHVDALSAVAVMRFATNVAGPAGTLLVLDNLHDADDTALDRLARLVRLAADVPVRIVAAFRDGVPGLTSLLSRLAHEQLIRHVTLGPLSRTDSAGLLTQLLEAGPRPPTGWQERVLEEAGGVPYYLVTWAQELRTGQLGPTADAVPWAIRQSIRDRIEAMPSAVKPLLEAISIAGGRSAYSLLVALTARPEEQLLDALERACRERLLEEEGQTYRFAYGVVRRIVEGDLSYARRAILSRRLGAIMNQAPSSGTTLDGGRTPSELEERAYHLAVLRRHQRSRFRVQH